MGKGAIPITLHSDNGGRVLLFSLFRKLDTRIETRDFFDLGLLRRLIHQPCRMG